MMTISHEKIRRPGVVSDCMVFLKGNLSEVLLSFRLLLTFVVYKFEKNHGRLTAHSRLYHCSWLQEEKLCREISQTIIQVLERHFYEY